MQIVNEIQDLFIRKQWTLCTAESCTGGSVAAHLTRIPGASKYFLGAIVAYANFVKTDLLMVPQAVLQEKGAVSAEVAAHMAMGALTVMGSDFSIAATGIAGPTGGSDEKPVGTVWGAIGCRDKPPHVWKFHAAGNREKIIEYSVETLLKELLTVCRKGM